MNSRPAAVLLLLILTSSGVVWGQMPSNGDALKERMRREDYYLRIDRKIDRDIKATRIKVVPIDPETFPLQAILLADGREVDFRDGSPSQLYFLVNEGRADAPVNFEIIPVAIQRQQLVASDSALLGRTQMGERTFSTVLHLKDIARLGTAEQQAILGYIADNIALSRDVLEVPILGKTSQQVFPHHRDYWSYAKANSRYPVPLLDKEKSRKILSSREKNDRAAAAERPAGQSVVRQDSSPLDTVGTNVVLLWRHSTPPARYAVAVAGDSAFANLRFRQTTSDTTMPLPFLENGSHYFWRVQLASADDTGGTTLFVKTFTTRMPADARTESNGNERLGYALDFSLSKITFTHELLFSEHALGIPGFGVEIRLDDPLLSLLTYQAPAIAWGGRLLLNATGDKRDILDKDFLELKLLAKTRFNARQFYEDLGALKYPFTPLVSADQPSLNIATPGFAFEIATSKWWDLPYLNFSFSSGSTRFENPVSVFGPEGKHSAYWSTTQWRGSMAFYFNLDSEPEFYIPDGSRKRLNIVRLDLGVGTYNVSRADYDPEGKVLRTEGLVRSSRIQPYVSAEYVHASQVKTGFGGKLVYFDNRVTLTMWISLFKIGYHELRLEGTQIMGPFGRGRFDWETTGGTLMQFRYRLGF